MASDEPRTPMKVCTCNRDEGHYRHCALSQSNEPRELRSRTVQSLYGAIGVDSRTEYDVVIAVLAEVAQPDERGDDELTEIERCVRAAANEIREAVQLKAGGV